MAAQIMIRHEVDPTMRGSVSPIRYRRSRAQHEDGTALVELALTITILLTVLFGIISMSLAAYSYFFVSDAARQATRYAIVRGSTCSTYSPNLTNCNVTSDEIQTYVQALAFPAISSNNLTATASWYSPSSGTPTTWSLCSPRCTGPGNAVKVNVTYTLPLLIPFIPKTTLTLTSNSQMVIAQ